MAFTNYLTSFKLHLLKHIRETYTFNDTSRLQEAEVKAYVYQLTNDSAIPIPQETFAWLAQYFQYVKDKDQLLVYDNVTGLWHFEPTDDALRNILTDYFTLVAEEAKTAGDMIFYRYAQSFFKPNAVPNLVRRIKSGNIYSVRRSADIVEATEHLRYFQTDDKRRALLDMSKNEFNLRSVSFKETQQLHLLHKAPVPIATTDEEPTLWLSLIDQYMMGDPEKVAYFKKVLAYLMSPYNYNQAYIYFIGPGRNGKGTILKVLQDILGPHAVRMNAELLNAKPSPSFKKDDALAATEGRSLYIFNEIDERMIASTQSIKDLTEGGRDEFKNKIMTVVRPAYSRNYEINICGTPIIVANSLINFGDWSMLDPIFKRLVLVPFDYVIRQEDPTILNRLAQEYPKIQAWLYLNYFEHKGIRIKDVPKPAAFERRYLQYREDSDVIGLFFEECLTFTGNPADEMLRSELYRMYKLYCDSNGRRPIRNKGTNGFAALKDPYLEQATLVLRTGSYYYQGIKKSQYFKNEVIG